MCALKLVSDAVPKVTDKVFQRKFVALGRIVTRWEDIVGAKLAQLAQPQKIRYRKAKKKGDKPHAVLEIATSSANASLLVMQKGMLLEKINYIFGDDWITDIKFIHQASNEAPKPISKTKTLTEAEKNRLSRMLDGIEDPEIKEKLMAMGQSLLEDDDL
ncbi:MAG: DciA family protein [Pseudomonadota bacterium]